MLLLGAYAASQTALLHIERLNTLLKHIIYVFK